MRAETVVLVGDDEQRLGSATVTPACYVLSYEDRYFYRTDKKVRVFNARGPLLTVFEETEIWKRTKLNPV